MRKIAWATLALCCSLSSAALAEDRYFITNQSGVTIDELYVSASGQKSWGKDILGRDVMANGEGGEITFHPEDQRCKWDVAIKDEAGNAIEWHDIDLCEYTKITLKPGGVAELQ